MSVCLLKLFQVVSCCLEMPLAPDLPVGITTKLLSLTVIIPVSSDTKPL